MLGFKSVYLLFLSAANLVAFGIAFKDQSWLALLLATVGNIVLNALFIVGGGIALYCSKERRVQSSWLTVIGAPLLALIVQYLSITSLDLSGC